MEEPPILGLFFQAVGARPMRFAMDLRELSDDANLSRSIQDMIREGGGLLEDPKVPDKTGHRIRLVDPRRKSISSFFDKEDDVFSYEYVRECYQSNRLQTNLSEFRVNSRSIYEKYEPMRVLLGHITWQRVPKRLSVQLKHVQDDDGGIECSDIEDNEVVFRPNKQKRSPEKKAATVPGKTQTSRNSPEKARVSPEKAPKSPGESRKSPEKAQKSPEKVQKSPEKVQKSAEKVQKSPEKVQKSPEKVQKSPEKAQKSPEKVQKSLEKVQKVTAVQESPVTESEPVCGTSSSSVVSYATHKKKDRIIIKMSRAPYTRHERESIVNHIAENHAYNMLKGNVYWKHAEKERKVCGGQRTWQSMKEHFRKQIIPTLHTFDLPLATLQKIKCGYDGFRVDLTSSSDSDADEQSANKNDVKSDVSTDVKSDVSTDLDEAARQASTPFHPGKRSLFDPISENWSSSEESSDEVYASVEMEVEPETRKSPRLQQQQSDNNKKRQRKRLWNAQAVVVPEPISFLNDEALERAARRKNVIVASQPVKASTSNGHCSGPQSRKAAEKEEEEEMDSLQLDSTEEEEEEEEKEEDIVLPENKGVKRLYSHAEEEKIVCWIAKNRRFVEVGGNNLWKLMEVKKVVPNRTSQSMKERFRKHMLPRIDFYNGLSEADKHGFKRTRMTKKLRKTSSKKK